MMQRFLKQTKVEIDFLVKELEYLLPFFITKTNSQAFFEDSELRLVTPFLEASDEHNKQSYYEVFKRIVLKLAAGIERVYLFTQE